MHETQPLPAVTPGEILAGKYRVERKIGEGGMGIVVVATNVALGTRVAIKLLRPSALANAEALGRFEREARAAASLRSEHVARAIDIGKLADGRPYMVMEYLEGQDLSDFIVHSGPIAFSDAVDFLLQACEAVAEAHATGIIHRDLKPKNLFLTHTVDGRPLVKVLDFGISKIEGPAEEMSLTRTTEIIGSPSYMSPEQLRASRDVDARTDLWALGVILYELCTKRLPFYANTVTELVAVVLMEQHPPIKLHRPDVPEGLEQIVARCLGKRPDDRFASVGELAHFLKPFASPSGAAIADRVVGVARQSGRLSGPLPPVVGSVPPATSSARIAVHGATATAWGETQVERRGRSGGRWPVALGLAASLLVVGVGAASGAVWYVKRSTPALAASPSPPASAEPMPLPPGRKDLPPLPSASTSAAETPPPAPSETASARPPRPAVKPPPAPSAKPPAGDNPLDNIGRR